MARSDDQLIRRPPEDLLAIPPREDTWRDAGLSGIVRYILQVFTERWLIIAATLALGVVALGAYLILLPHKQVYEAEVQMLVEPESRAPLIDNNDTQSLDTNSGYYETQQRILKSRTLARRTLASLKAPASEANQVPSTAEELAAADKIPANEVDRFLGSLSVNRISNTSLIEVRFLASDPEYAAKVANAHTQAYVRQSVELMLLASRQASNWLLQPLEEQKGKLQAGEAELKRYQRDYGRLEDRQALQTQRLTELNATVLRTRANRVSKETAYRQLELARRSGKPLHDFAGLVSSASMVQQLSGELASLQRRDAELSAQYGPRHPERVKIAEAIAFTTGRLDEEVGRAIDAAGRDVEAARQEEQRAIASLDSQTSESSTWSRKAVDYEALKREVANDRTLFEKLEQHSRQLHLASGYELSNIRVMDPAEVPSSPIPDHRRRNVALAGFASVLLSLVLAFGVHYLDARLRSPEDIRAHLGLPYLGMVPKLRTCRSPSTKPSEICAHTFCAHPRDRKRRSCWSPARRPMKARRWSPRRWPPVSRRSCIPCC
jgi:succinoglycan biosynthesis transport protein ExoP